MRPSKEEYYLDIALSVSNRSTCLRRKYGSVIVKEDEIIATGYTGSPRGVYNCSDLGVCKRKEMNIPRGERYELCRSVHSEMNAIISASRQQMIGSEMYIYGSDDEDRIVEGAEPCSLCKRLIINSGIEKVIVKDREENVVFIVSDWIVNGDIEKIGY